MARSLRRRQAEEALELEQEREVILNDQLESLVGEAGSEAVDESAFERMDAEDIAIVREFFTPDTFVPDDVERFFVELDELDAGGGVDPLEEELTRLNEEIVDCRRRQHAFQAYLDALVGETMIPHEPPSH